NLQQWVNEYNIQANQLNSSLYGRTTMSLIGDLIIKDFPKLKAASFIANGYMFKLTIDKLTRMYIPDNLLEAIKLPANPVVTGSIYYEYSAKDKDQLKGLLSKQERQTIEASSSSPIRHSFYKKFFDDYLQNKKSELANLKKKINEEENGQLDIYLQLQQSTDKDKIQMKKVKRRILKKLTIEDLQKILKTNEKINELEKQVNEIKLINS
ncbi:16262_t:CDS:2, partial [Dentiscutata heterogama]